MKNSQKKTLKSFAALFCVLSLIVAAAGCAGRETAQGGLTEVKIWNANSHSKDTYLRLINAFNNTRGKELGVKVVYEIKEGDLNQMLDLAFTSGQAPDIFSGGSLDALVDADRIAALEDMAGGQELIDKYQDGLIYGSHVYNGKTYGLPLAVTTRGLIYNKDMFKKAGIVDAGGEPTPPKTYAELRDYARRLTNPSAKEYGIIFPMKWSGWFSSDMAAGMQSSVGHAGYVPTAGKYDYTGMKPILEAFMGIKEDGSYVPGLESIDNDPARARFAEGGIGMKFAFSFDVAVLNDQFPAKIDWGVAPLPVVDDGEKYLQTMAVKGSMRINKQSLETIGADKLMAVYSYIASDEFVTELYKDAKEIPFHMALTGGAALNEAKTGWKEFTEMIAISHASPVEIKTDISGETELKDLFINSVWSGKMSIDEALAAYTKVKNEGIERYKKINPDYDGSRFILDEWNIRR